MSIPGVSVYLRKNKVYVVSTYSPGPGTYIEQEPVFVADESLPEAIGENVIKAISYFIDGGEMPDWSRYRSPLLAAAGVASWSEFNRKCRECVLDRHIDHFRVRSELPHKSVPLTASPSELGLAVLGSLGYGNTDE